MAIDMTTGSFHNSGWNWISFSDTDSAATSEQLAKKDVTGKHILIEQVLLTCISGGNLAIYDGSTKASPFLRCPPCDGSAGGVTMPLDFRGDPVDLTNEDGTSLCISCTGTYSGFIKYGWGV